MKFHIISHTHWDREWHKTYQEYRVRLIRFMDDLMNALENDPEYKSFMLDGQTSLLDDYLEIKPEMENRLQKLIKEGRIIIGPWYVQPDEFLPSGESLIRNLLIGYKMGLKFGGYMDVGYLPDSFGQSAQMPQILKGFEIDSAVFYRGITEEDSKNTEFIWKAPDGKEVMTVILPIGYGNAMFLSPNLEKSIEQVEENIKLFKDRVTSEHILMMAGSDQCVAKKFLPDICKKLTNYYQNKDENHTFEISSLEKYISSIINDGKNFIKLSGEFRKPKTRRTHNSIGGTRLDIKKTNYEIQNLYERYLEPISVMSKITGDNYDQHLINRGWKYIIENHAHDSICCVCKDIVHDEMLMRMEFAKQIGNTILDEKYEYLSRKIKFNKALGRPFIVYNTMPVIRRDVVDATILVKNKDFKLFNSRGEEIDYIINDSKTINLADRKVVFGENPDDYYYEMNISFITEVEGYGYHTHYLKEGIKPSRKTTNIINNNVMENEKIKVTIEKDGSITVFDKNTEVEYKNLNIFEESGNAGDEYDYSPPLEDTVFTSHNKMVSYEILENNFLKGVVKINYKMRVPKTTENEKRSEEMVDLNISSILTLYKGKGYLEIKTKINNTATNHRIRVLFDTSIKTDKHFAENSFGIIERPNEFKETELSIKEGWHERYYPIYPQKSFVAVEDREKGLSIFNKGLPQYETLNNQHTEIAVTILSSVGWMGKEKLMYRPGRRSGALCETPKAQMLGDFEVEYAIYPYRPNERERLFNDAYGYCTPLKTLMVLSTNENGFLSDEFKIFEIENPIMQSSAIKLHEFSNGIVWRVYNATNKRQKEVKLKFNNNIFKNIELLNLREEVIKSDNRIEVEMKETLDGAGYTYPSGNIVIKDVEPNEIFTLKFS